MNKPVYRWILVFLLFVVVIVIIFAVGQVNAQNESAEVLDDRLKLRGVPVKHVITASRIPFVIEIALQSSSDNDGITVDDNWYILLAKREAKLAYQIMPRISSYKLKVFNTKGEVIHSTQSFLDPSFLSQQLTPIGESKVSNEETREIVKSELELGEFSLDMLEVISDDFPGSNGQILHIQVSAPDLDAANRSVDRFVDSVRSMTYTINQEYGTSIILCHVQILDSQGGVLLDFVRDLEISLERRTIGVGGLIFGSSPPMPKTATPGKVTPDISSTPYPFHQVAPTTAPPPPYP